MQDFDIVKQTDKIKSFRVEKLVGMFDIQQEHLTQRFTGQLELPPEWSVGAIVGRSGTGKTTIARELFDIFKTDYSQKSIVDEMPEDKTVEEITKAFINVGFSSPPSWLKTYNILSNGEKMRVDLAKALLSNQNVICFDEFTSVVDRKVAKIVSMVVSKTIRKERRKFVAVSCHSDILDWLEPDWVFSTDEMGMIDVKKKDQFSNLMFMNLTQRYGKYLASITI